MKPWSKIVEDSKERIHTFTNKSAKTNENTDNADNNTSSDDATTANGGGNIFQKNKTKLQNLYETKPGAVKIGTSLILAALLLILLSTALILKPNNTTTENIAIAPDATAANTAPVDETFVTANTEVFLSSIGMLLTSVPESERGVTYRTSIAAMVNKPGAQDLVITADNPNNPTWVAASQNNQCVEVKIETPVNLSSPVPGVAAGGKCPGGKIVKNETTKKPKK